MEKGIKKIEENEDGKSTGNSRCFRFTFLDTNYDFFF